MKHIVLKSYCDGLPELENFALEEVPTPSPGEGEFLVRHIWASVDPGTRSRLSGRDSYTGAQPWQKFQMALTFRSLTGLACSVCRG